MKFVVRSLSIGLGLVLAFGMRAASLPEAKGRRVLEPFNYRGVALESGPLRDQVEEVRKFYLSIPDDDLLKGFRARAGKPAPGNDLGGWYSSDTFLIFGQMVSGLARLHAGTGDPACREKVERLLSEWAKCIEPDGYFYASRKPNAPHYVYDKMLWGLLDARFYCGNREALDHLGRITDWAIKNLERSRKVNDTSTEWYTLSENLYRAYLATGETKYREFGAVWEYSDYWGVYARNGDIFAARPDGTRTEAYHAYSHVNTLGGAGMAFLLTGQPPYLDTLKNACDYLQAQQCFVSGGFGPDEQLLPRGKFLDKLGDTHNSFETQCGSWAGFKLGKYLLSFTGDARYGDWIERLVINGIGASIPMTPDGRVLYYSDYHLHGGAKHNIDFGWSCCAGTRPQAVADYHDLIYFHDARDLFVNLYTPSTVRWPRQGGAVVVSQNTRFPESDEARFSLTLAEPAEFGLKFRVPGWVAGPVRALVNGRKAELPIDDLHWATLRRQWSSGDKVHLQLPMKVWISSLNAATKPPACALCGPVMLAFDAPDTRSLRAIDVAALAQDLKPLQKRPLCFVLATNEAVQARPFYSYRARERYYVYLDPNLGLRISHRNVKFAGKWNHSGLFRFSNEVGATAECEFEGTGVRWLGRRFDDAGKAEISIDGRIIGSADQFGPGRDLPFDWCHKGLAPGRHTIQLRLLPEKIPQSKDRYLNVAGFEVLADSK